MTDAALRGGGARSDPVQVTFDDNAAPRQCDTSSREVDWHAVALFADPLLTRFSSLPLPGTPEWVALPDTDPRKLAALINVARFWALDATCSQEAIAEASKAITASADWSELSRQIPRRRSVYVRRSA